MKKIIILSLICVFLFTNSKRLFADWMDGTPTDAEKTTGVITVAAVVVAVAGYLFIKYLYNENTANQNKSSQPDNQVTSDVLEKQRAKEYNEAIEEDKYNEAIKDFNAAEAELKTGDYINATSNFKDSENKFNSLPIPNIKHDDIPEYAFKIDNRKEQIAKVYYNDAELAYNNKDYTKVYQRFDFLFANNLLNNNNYLNDKTASILLDVANKLYKDETTKQQAIDLLNKIVSNFKETRYADSAKNTLSLDAFEHLDRGNSTSDERDALQNFIKQYPNTQNIKTAQAQLDKINLVINKENAKAEKERIKNDEKEKELAKFQANKRELMCEVMTKDCEDHGEAIKYEHKGLTLIVYMPGSYILADNFKTFMQDKVQTWGALGGERVLFFDTTENRAIQAFCK
jgi:outer membrane protein assembly factor BamD (BamD/ComL family)